MEKRLFEKGEIICKEHEVGSEMYVILSGSVIPYKTINNQKLELSAVGSGNFFGEMCLFSRNTRTATVVAAEPCEILVLTKDTLLDKLKSDPRLAVKIIETLIIRLEHTHDLIEELEGAKSSFELMYKQNK